MLNLDCIREALESTTWSDKPEIHSCDPAHSGCVLKPGQPGFMILRNMNATIILVNRDRHGPETCFALATAGLTSDYPRLY